MLYQFSVTAANAAVNNNLLDHGNVPMKFMVNQPRARVLDYIGFSGSAAAADTQIEIRVGGKTYGTVFNESTGTHNKDAIFPVGTQIPAGVDFELIVIDAAATNPVYTTLVMRYI